MRRLLALALLAATPALAQSPTSPEPATIIAAENLFWTNYTSGNTTELAKQLLPSFQNVEEEIWDRGQVLNFVATFHKMCSLAPVTLRSPRVTFIDPTTATIVYSATETPTCAGKTLSGETTISTVWLLRPGAPGEPARWQMHLHTEYAIPPKP